VAVSCCEYEKFTFRDDRTLDIRIVQQGYGCVIIYEQKNLKYKI
jgi:hypothetical protein